MSLLISGDFFGNGPMALSVARECSADFRIPEHREATDLSHRSRQAHNNTRNL